ncbi:glycosyltransferase, partial [bacterium]|nr:glycosyltransferase [bacterium]
MASQTEHEPIVSIIIPVYNDEKHVADAIESALAQTLKEVEVIVVDDGSTDGTAQVLTQYEGRIKIVRQENRGVSAFRNAGLHASRGKYICFLDSDDTFMPRKAEMQAGALERHPDAGLCYGAWEGVSQHTKMRKLLRGPELEQLAGALALGMFAICSVALRRSWAVSVGGFDESLASGEDRDFWWRLLRAGCQPIRIRQVVATVRGCVESRWRGPEQILNSHVMMLDRYFGAMGTARKHELRAYERYAKAWIGAGAGWFRRGERQSAVTAWVKAIDYWSSVFEQRGTWYYIFSAVYPDLFCANSGSDVLSADDVDVVWKTFVQAAQKSSNQLASRKILNSHLVALRSGILNLAVSRGRPWHAYFWLMRLICLRPSAILERSSWRQLARISACLRSIKLVRSCLAYWRSLRRGRPGDGSVSLAPSKSHWSDRRSIKQSQSGLKPLKVALIMGSFPDDGKMGIVCTARRMAEHGHNVTVFADGPGRRFSTVETRPEEEFKVHYFGHWNNSVGLIRLLLAAGRALIVHPIRTQQVLWAILRNCSDLRAVLDGLNRLLPFAGRAFDVVHFQFGHTSLRFGPVVALKKTVSTAIVQSFRGHDLLAWKGLSRSQRNDLCRSVDGFHVVSCAVKADVRRLLGQRATVCVVKDSLDPSIFRASLNSGYSSDVCQIVTVASLWWAKGFEYSLQALRLLADRGVRFRHTILGDGPQRQWIEYTIDDLGIAELVSLRGFQPYKKLQEILSKSDIFLLTSVCEGLCASCLEAQAMGLPTVVSDAGGLPEAVCDGVTGF